MRHFMKHATMKMLALAVSFSMLANVAFALSLDLGDGSVDYDTANQTVTQNAASQSVENDLLELTGGGNTGNTVTVHGGGDAIIVLNNVNIETNSGSAIENLDNSHVIINTVGTNNIKTTDNNAAAIHNASSDLFIYNREEASLNVSSGNSSEGGGAAIGSSRGEDMDGDIMIVGPGSLTAESTRRAAAIGSGVGGNVNGNIIIYDTTVDASSGGNGAGIGTGVGGSMGQDSSVYIDQSTVNAGSDNNGAAIGSAKDGDMNGSIYILDSNVTATANGAGAALGAGQNGNMAGAIIAGPKADLTLDSQENKLGTDQNGTIDGESAEILLGDDTVINGTTVSEEMLLEEGMTSDPEKTHICSFEPLPQPAEENTRLTIDSCYWVTSEGKGIAAESSLKDGVLTVSCDPENAEFHSTVYGLRFMMDKGVKTIVFKTAGAETSMNLEKLTADQNQGAAILLTHESAKASLSIDAADKTDLLK